MQWQVCSWQACKAFLITVRSAPLHDKCRRSLSGAPMTQEHCLRRHRIRHCQLPNYGNILFGLTQLQLNCLWLLLFSLYFSGMLVSVWPMGHCKWAHSDLLSPQRLYLQDQFKFCPHLTAHARPHFYWPLKRSVLSGPPVMISFRCDCTKIAPLFLIRLKYFSYRNCKCSNMLIRWCWNPFSSRKGKKEECRRTGKSVISVMAVAVAVMMCAVCSLTTSKFANIEQANLSVEPRLRTVALWPRVNADALSASSKDNHRREEQGVWPEYARQCNGVHPHLSILWQQQSVSFSFTALLRRNVWPLAREPLAH